MSELPTPAVTTPQPEKRRKSLGEHLFNATTYGGVTWIGNEALSTIIGNWTEKAGSLGHRLYQGGLAKLPEWGAKPYRILMLTIGGNSLVPVVKMLEDNKGALVRKADTILEGERSRNDPTLELAHKEMDNAPKQSWGSLWKGRAVVMGLAVALDYLCGGEKAPTRKWLDGTAASKYSTMERASTTITRDALSAKYSPFKWLERDPAKREAIAAIRNTPLAKGAALPAIDAAKEGKVAAVMGGTFGFVLVLSAMLSAIFYASSRVFAAKRDEKEQRKDVIHDLEEKGIIPPARHHFLDKESATDIAPIPSSAISQVTHEKTVAPKAELQLAGS